MRLTLCLRHNTMSDTSSIHFLAVNHGGCKQTLRLVFPTDAHYTQQRALAMGFICHFLQITSLNHLILTATRQKRKCKDTIVANKGRVLSCYRETALSFVRSKWTPCRRCSKIEPSEKGCCRNLTEKVPVIYFVSGQGRGGQHIYILIVECVRKD